MMEYSPRRTASPTVSVGMGIQQSRRLLLALVLLLTALAAVLIKDRDFWFGGSSSTIDAYVPDTTPAAQKEVTAPAQPAQTLQPQVAKKKATPAPATAESKSVEGPSITAKRTILPPLEVEVVAGSHHRNLRPGSNVTKLDTTNSQAAAPAPNAATNAAERQSLAQAAQPAYPPLAQHMNVQGAVVLQALVGTDGVIENLRVLSGPAILAAAAQQAVREWRFKPILENGQAVESKATITVNFTIKVADSSANTTVAESRAADTLIITR